jgi:hypothetical protein
MRYTAKSPRGPAEPRTARQGTSDPLQFTSNYFIPENTQIPRDLIQQLADKPAARHSRNEEPDPACAHEIAQTSHRSRTSTRNPRFRDRVVTPRSPAQTPTLMREKINSTAFAVAHDHPKLIAHPLRRSQQIQSQSTMAQSPTTARCSEGADEPSPQEVSPLPQASPAPPFSRPRGSTPP